MKNIFGRHLGKLAVLSVSLLLGCTDSQQLSPTPSLLELDDVKPTCGGLTSMTVTAGPSLSLTWAQGADNVSQVSALTYKIFVRKNAESYDLVSPAKIVSGATSTLISNGVSVGNSYTAFVTCTDENGNTHPTGPLAELSVSVIDSQPPAQVTDLQAGNATFTSILLSWSPSDDGTGGTTASNMRYSVYGATSASVSTSGSPLQTVTGSTSYLHTGLTPGVPWYYKVVAIDALSNRAPESAEATATTVADTTAPSFAGGNPTITVSATTSSTISLSWTAATDDVSAVASLRYRVFRCSPSTSCDPFAGTLVTTTAAGTVTYTDTGLIASTAYTYGIRAEDGSSNVSTNTGKKLASTTYASSGTFYAYPTVDEANFRAGSAVAVANVVGNATGAEAFPDLIVGAPNASEPGNAFRYTGCVYIFAGTGTGTFSTTATHSFCSPNAIANGTVNGLNFGSAIATGDIDADGTADIVVSAPLRSNVYIFRTVNTSGVLSVGTSPTTVPHGSGNTTFGTGLCLGDSDSVAGSGLDLFVIATSENCSTACGGATATGNVMVFHNGSTAGNYIAPTTVNYRISPTHSLQASGYNISNSEVVARSCAFGKFDPNNSTESQLVVGSGTVSFASGAGTDGMVAFYRKTGAATFTYQNVFPTTTPAITATRWGDAVAAIQLGVSTGTQELAVGAPTDVTVGAVSGAAFVYNVSTSSSNFSLTATGDAFYGGTDFDNNGTGAALAAGNIWGASTDPQDLVVGANLDDLTTAVGASALNFGQIYTYRNVSGTISAAAQQNNFDYSALRAKNDQQFASALCRGDVNNDGYQDVIVGVPATDYDPVSLVTNTNMGSVNVYYGKSAGEMDFSTPSQVIYAPGAHANGSFGSACVVMDYNGDGSQDLLVGSPYRDVGANADRGVVYIYQGSTGAALPSSSSTSLNSPTATTTALFGSSLAKGDFDGNGYDDLAVGAIGINSGAAASGRVYVYWALTTVPHAITTASMVTLDPPNGASGSGTNPHLANTQTLNASLNFGRALESFKTVSSSAGVDLVVCSLVGDVVLNEIYAASPAATDLGKCWIYEGAVNGGLGTYAMMTSPRNEIRYPLGYSTPANTLYFGASITRGLWNADAFEDLVICSSRQTNLDTLVTLAGSCFAYYGKSGGGFETSNSYNPNASGTRYTPLPDDVHYNPNAEANASRFGEAVLLTDINNNSTADLIVGEPFADNVGNTTNLGFDSGRLYIIRGGY